MGLCLSKTTFPCYFCNKDDPSNGFTNIGYSWKQTPSDWSSLPEFASHAMAISGYSHYSESYIIASLGGYNTTGPALFTNVFSVINITLNPPLSEQTPNYSESLTIIPSQYLNQPYFGHTLTAYPACSDCRISNSKINKDLGMYPGLIALGSYPVSTSPVPEFSVTAIILNPDTLTVNTTVDLSNSTVRPSHYDYGRYMFSAVHTTYYARNVGFSSTYPAKYDTAGSIIIFGGWTLSNFTGNSTFPNFNEVWAFHIPTENWELLHSGNGVAPRPRHLHTAVTFENKMVIYGGTTRGLGSDLDLNSETWIFHYDTKTWEFVNPSTSFSPPGLFQHVSVATSRDTVLIHGGCRQVVSDGVSNCSPMNTLYELDITTNEWSILCDPRPENNIRWLHAAVMLDDDVMLIYGGYIYITGPVFSNTVLIFDYTQPRQTVFCEQAGNICVRPGVCFHNNLVNCSYPCADGSCASSLGGCPKGDCPAGLGFRCLNGQCVGSPSDCIPVSRCPVGQQRCNDGSCSVKCNITISQCPLFCDPTENVTTCLPSCCINNCSSISPPGSMNWTSSCCLSPILNQCCPYNSTCCTSSLRDCKGITGYAEMCIDGTCQQDPYYPCHVYDGCSVGKYQCPTGRCANSLSDCRESCPTGSIMCHDGTCVNENIGCSSLPLYWTRPPYNTISLNTPSNFLYFDTLDKFAIGFLSTSLFAGAVEINIELIAESLVSKISNSAWTPPPAVTGNTNYYANVWSPIVTISYYCTIIPCSPSFELYLNFDQPIDTILNYACLAYWDKTTNSWNCTGLTWLDYITDSTSNPVQIGVSSLNGFSKSDYLYSGTFAIVRSGWAPPTASEVSQYIADNYNPVNFFGTPYTSSSSIYTASTQTFCLNVPEIPTPNFTLIQQSVTNMLNDMFNFPSSKTRITVTEDDISSQYIICIQLSDSVFPPISSPVIVTPPSNITVVPQMPPTSGNLIGSPDFWSTNTGYLTIGLILGGALILTCIGIIVFFCIKSKYSKMRKPNVRHNTTTTTSRSNTSRRNRPVASQNTMNRVREIPTDNQPILKDHNIEMNEVKDGGESFPMMPINEPNTSNLLLSINEPEQPLVVDIPVPLIPDPIPPPLPVIPDTPPVNPAGDTIGDVGAEGGEAQPPSGGWLLDPSLLQNDEDIYDM